MLYYKNTVIALSGEKPICIKYTNYNLKCNNLKEILAHILVIDSISEYIYIDNGLMSKTFHKDKQPSSNHVGLLYKLKQK